MLSPLRFKSRTSILASVPSLTPKRRAGITFVSLMTRQSSGFRYSIMSGKSGAPAFRSPGPAPEAGIRTDPLRDPGQSAPGVNHNKKSDVFILFSFRQPVIEGILAVVRASAYAALADGSAWLNGCVYLIFFQQTARAVCTLHNGHRTVFWNSAVPVVFSGRYAQAV